MERTLVLIKPDAVQRGLMGEIISRLERKGLQLVAMKMFWMDKELATKHYFEHTEKSFYPKLEEFVTSAPSIAMIWQGDSAASIVRELIGATDSRRAAAGTIRGDYGMSMRNNLVHASDCVESANREMSLFFNEEEIFDHDMELAWWLGYDEG